MKGEKKAENCSFTSYLTERNGEVPSGSGGSYGHRAGSGRVSAGIFGEVRRMRREDERREGFGAFRAPRFSKRREPSAAAQAGKFAVLLACICAFSLLFALKLAKSDMQGEALAVFRAAAVGESEEEAEEETLGRLRLVRLPGLLSVFAASDRPVAPLFAEQAVTDDSFTARLFSTPGTQVVSILSGKVRSVDPAGEHGGSVTICCADGVDVTYMGLSEILVERGQPVLQRTVLGKLSGEILYLRVTKDGRPIDPLEFLGTAARVG